MKIMKFIFKTLYFLFKVKLMTKALGFLKYSYVDQGVIFSQCTLLSCWDRSVFWVFMENAKTVMDLGGLGIKSVCHCVYPACRRP